MSILMAFLTRCLLFEHLDIQVFITFSLNDFFVEDEFNDLFNENLLLNEYFGGVFNKKSP